MSRSLGRSSVLNANSFGSVCEAEEPLTWSVSQFYREVMSPMSSLEPLLYADVTDVICYHQRGGVGHDYVIMCIRPRVRHDHFGERIWARCERNPGPHGGPLSLSAVSPPASDTIKLSFDRPKLRRESDIVIMESAFRNLLVLHVADLLRRIHSVSPTYGVASHNCWWFAAVTIGTLRVFGKDWTIQPSRDWVRSAIKVLGRDTAKSSEEVTRLFVQAWNVGGQSEFIPITSHQAWGDQRHALVLDRRAQPLRTPTDPIPINRSRSNQVPEPSRVHMGSLSSQHPPAMQPTPSGLGRTNALWSTQVFRSSPESGIGSLPRTPNSSSSENASLPPVSDGPELFHQTSVVSQGRHPTAGTSALQFNTGNTPPPVYQELPIEFTDPVQSSSTSRRPSNASDVSSHAAIPPYHSHRGANPYIQQDGANPRFPDWPRSTVQTVPEEEGESSGLPPDAPNGPQSPVRELPSPTASNTWGPSQHYTPSVYSNSEEREGLKELIFRIIWNRNPGDVQVLLAVYPSFTTGAELLSELKSWFKRTPRDHEHAYIIRPRVIEILRQWVTSESFDPTLGYEVQRFLARQVAVDPDFAASQDLALMGEKLARPPHPSGEADSPSSSGASLGLISPAGSKRGKRPSSGGRMPDSLAKMKDKDLAELARVLEAMELESRFTITIPRVVRWLTWTKGTQSSNSRAFSPHSDKIAAWVLDSCLNGSIDTRAATYSSFLSLAEHCKQSGNLASVSDLLYGLRSSLITRLKFTLKLAGNADDRLNALIQSLHPRNPHRFHSINARIQALVTPFGETSPEPGKISWTRCHLLYTELQKAVALPTETSLPLVDPSYYSFVAVRMHSAWQNRGTHHIRSQRLVEEEPDQMRRRTSRAAGFSR